MEHFLDRLAEHLRDAEGDPAVVEERFDLLAHSDYFDGFLDHAQREAPSAGNEL